MCNLVRHYFPVDIFIGKHFFSDRVKKLKSMVSFFCSYYESSPFLVKTSMKHAIIYLFKRDIWNLSYIVFIFSDKIKPKIKACSDDFSKHSADRIFFHTLPKFTDMFDDFNENLSLSSHSGGLFVKSNGVHLFSVLNSHSQ